MWSGVLNLADELFKVSNQGTSEETENPESRYTSGGPDSEVSWDSPVRKGRDFVAEVAPMDEINAFSGKTTAVESIRVYVRIESGDAQQRAEIAVKDLQAMGASDREQLALATGTGWVDEYAADPLEYMYNGDTTIAATQCSYLPSWLSFLVDQDKAKEAGVSLFDPVYAVWKDPPTSECPKLVVFG